MTRAMRVLWIAVLAALVSIVQARAQEPDQTAEQTDADARYSADKGLAVRETPSATARIVYDIPTGVSFRGQASDAPGWFRITAVGPPHGRLKGSNWKLRLTPNGRLPQAASLDRFYPVRGYVPADAVQPDDGLEAALDPHLVDVPQPWEGIGIRDKRKFVIDWNAAPFNAVVPLQTTVDGKFGYCTGFFVGDNQTIVIARHCIGENMRAIVEAPGELVNTTVTLVAQGGGDDKNGTYEDWAILHTTVALPTRIEPLSLGDAGSIIGHRRVELMVLGFPSDLLLAGQHDRGKVRPVATFCDFDGVETSGDGTAPRSTMTVHACAQWHGNSGGPILAYVKGRYVVVSILTGSAKPSLFGMWDQDVQDIPRGLAVRIKDAIRAEATRVGEKDPASLAEQMELADGTTKAGYLSISTNSTPSIGSLYAGLGEQRYGDEGAKGEVSQSLFDALNQLHPGSAPTRLADSAISFESDQRLYDPSSNDDDADSYDRLARLTGVDQADVMPSRMALAQARILCAERCVPIALDRSRQLAFTDGDVIDLPMLHAQVGAAQYALYDTLPRPLQSALADRIGWAQRGGLMFAAGDLFEVEAKTMRVRWVVRDFIGSPLGALASADPHCELAATAQDRVTSSTPDIAGLSSEMGGETPATIAGVTTVSVRQATCLLRSAQPPLVLAAIEAKLSIPGALAVPWAAAYGPSVTDDVGTRLASAVRARLGGDMSRPILVYCHNWHCWLSVNLAKRLAAAGFTRIYWLRDGLEGWLTAGEPSVASSNLVQ